MEDKVIEKTKEKIKEILEQDINPNNVEYLYKLSKIKHLAKEDREMYGNYGNYNGYGNYGRGSYGREQYGEYGEYGARRRDSRGRYRGDSEIDRMSDEYGRYMESRERYGASPETIKSFKTILESMEDFARVLKAETQSPEELEMIRMAAQKIAQI